MRDCGFRAGSNWRERDEDNTKGGFVSRGQATPVLRVAEKISHSFSLPRVFMRVDARVCAPARIFMRYITYSGK